MLCTYFLGLSFRNTSRALQPFAERSHVAVWEWVQRFDPKKAYPCKRIAAFLIDKTQLQIGSTESWAWVGRNRTYSQSSFGSLYL
jgi:transposase-like protein